MQRQAREMPFPRCPDSNRGLKRKTDWNWPMTLLLYKDETWSFDEIKEGVCDILAQILERPAGTIRLDARLEEGLGVDSLALIQTQIGVEDHFDIATPEMDEATLEELRTVRDLVLWVGRHA